MEKRLSSQPVDSNYIEKLKVARSAIIQDSDTKSEKSNPVHQTTNEVAQEPIRKSEKKFDSTLLSGNFAQTFVQKFTSLERKKEAVEQEMAKIEKIYLSINEKKKQLGQRREEIIKMDEKLKALNKEIDTILQNDQL